jgi:hypothetical protein
MIAARPSAAAISFAMRPSDCRLHPASAPQAILTFLLCSMLAACIGVTPLPKRTRTPEGTEVKTVDLGFIQPGHTTRAEVNEELKLIDTGYQGDRYFLGRWSSSSMGGWAFIVGMGGGIANASRLWKSGNLLVEFDQGIVLNYITFPDKKLILELAPVAGISPAVPGRHELAVKYLKGDYKQVFPAKIVLAAGAFDFEELGTAKKPHKFTLPARDVLSVTTSLARQDPDPVFTTHTVHFARNLKPIGGPRGKTITLQVNTPDLVRLLSFISHSTERSEAAADSQH